MVERNFSVKSQRPLGTIDVSSEAIAMVAGITALECFGVVGCPPVVYRMGSPNCYTEKKT